MTDIDDELIRAIYRYNNHYPRSNVGNSLTGIWNDDIINWQQNMFISVQEAQQMLSVRGFELKHE